MEPSPFDFGLTDEWFDKFAGTVYNDCASTVDGLHRGSKEYIQAIKENPEYYPKEDLVWYINYLKFLESDIEFIDAPYPSGGVYRPWRENNE